MEVKVIEVNGDGIAFDNGMCLYSSHKQDCCENHYLSFGDLSLEDFDGLKFDLSNDNFFERVECYGIKLLPLNGHPIPVPGYSDNNGYYSDNLQLVLANGFKEIKTFDITECQR